ncbi:ATP-dependent RNA helicase, partial [Mesorhizobium sp. M7A.F.Ca.CA.003.01.2.1]
ADRFLAAIGPDRKLQGNILVKRLDGTPDLSRAGYQPPSPDKKPHRGKAPFDPNAPKRKFEKRAPAAADQRPTAPHDAKPWAKKPGKPKFDTSGAPKHKKAKKRPS